MALNIRGQAAVTDALFLLVVVGVLSSSLVYFSIQYGSTINRYVASQYIIDFETSAMKTILYSSVPRDPGKNLFESKQVDYLLAIVKEDYLGDSKLDPSTMDVLRNSSKIALKPLASNFDYLIFIQTVETPQDFVYIYLSSSTCDISGCSGTGGKAEYYCRAKDIDNVQGFLESVGYFAPVASGIKLSRATSTNDTEPFSAIMEMAMWVGAPLNSVQGTGKGKTVYILPDSDLLENVKFNDLSSPACNPDSLNQCRGILACKKIGP